MHGGGQISYHRTNDSGSTDWDGDGIADFGIRLNDDKPGTPTTNNQGAIPTSALLKIDKIIDDGNLSTGNARGDGHNYGINMNCAIGEMCIKFPN